MSIKQQLQRCLYHILKHNKDGSFETQHARRKILFKIAADLSQSNFKLRHLQGLKQKHIRFLNACWQSQGLAIATIKNRNAHLRWLSHKIGKVNLVPSDQAVIREHSGDEYPGISDAMLSDSDDDVELAVLSELPPPKEGNQHKRSASMGW